MLPDGAARPVRLDVDSASSAGRREVRRQSVVFPGKGDDEMRGDSPQVTLYPTTVVVNIEPYVTRR